MIDRLILLIIKNKLLISVFLIIATSVLLFFTLSPSSQLGESPLYEYDKLGHFTLFFGWTLVFGLFMFSHNNSDANLILIFMISAAFGISIEVLQGILPFNRNPNFYDVIADIAGSLTATGLLFMIKQYTFSKTPNELSEKMN